MWGADANTTSETFILSNEENGLVTQLVNAVCGSYNLYQAPAAIKEETDTVRGEQIMHRRAERFGSVRVFAGCCLAPPALAQKVFTWQQVREI